MKLTILLRPLRCVQCKQKESWGILLEGKAYCENCGADYSGIKHVTLLKMKMKKEQGIQYQQNKPSRKYF